ncbi:MAG TPA: DNA alkylation repair protein, partial [Blastocatellia bacterium]|nr:DNA alkylation repair protein [Blastocatellia bacterium]
RVFGSDMARKWIESKKELVAASGCSTLSSLVSIRDDASLDIPGLGNLLDRVAKTIHSQPNRVRYTMNGFVIAAGSYVPALTDKALDVAKKIGVVSVNVGDTACKVPDAASYIRKVADRGKIGKKRKTAKC